MLIRFILPILCLIWTIRAYREPQPLWHNKCLKAKCDVIFQPKCPPDSKLILSDPPVPPECCQKPGYCICDQKYCHDNFMQCPLHHNLVLIKESAHKPGYCCDQYKCLPPPADCSSTFCPPRQFFDCPKDSYRPDQLRLNETTRIDRRKKRKNVENVKAEPCCPQVEPCVCKPDYCKPVVCPEGYHLEILTKGSGVPGSCCDKVRCLSIVSKNVICEHKGLIYEDGEMWKPDPCSECVCRGGLIFCKKYECPETNWCSLVHVPEHECCPVCIGCKSEDGEFHNFTDQWQKDECTNCSCSISGAILCHEQMCSLECDDPVKIPGRCCPICEKPLVVQIPFVCPSIVLCHLLCEHGMKRDRMGCFICECETTDMMNPFDNASSTTTTKPLFTPMTNTVGKYSEKCPNLGEKTCSRKCGHGYERDERGCLTCNCKNCPPSSQCYKSCLYGFEVNTHGCTICKCKGSPSQQAVPSQIFVPPSSPAVNADGDATCKSAPTVGNRDHGEWWFDGCRYCYCDTGREFCSILSCPIDQNCANPTVIDENGCCSSCLGNSTTKIQNRLVCHSPGTGRSYVEGEFWSLNHCIQCTCHIGQVLCHRKACGPTPCPNTKIIPDQCCPICDYSKDKGAINGTMPPTVLKTGPRDNHCTVGSETYSSGSQWKIGSCKSCYCSNGLMNCFEEKCDDKSISMCHGRLLHLKNDCCRICSDSTEFGRSCSYKEIIYSVGEHWRDGVCRNCTCKAEGNVLCTQYECTKCPLGEDGQPAILSTVSPDNDDQCCPVCAFDSNNRFLWTPKDDIPSIYSSDFGRPNANTLPTLMMFCTFGLIAILFLLAILAFWIQHRRRRSTSRLCRAMSETSSSSSRSDPILRSVCGYHFPRHYKNKGMERGSPTALLSKTGSAPFIGSELKMVDGTGEGNYQQCRSLLALSPYDSDGGSTALTLDGGST